MPRFSVTFTNKERTLATVRETTGYLWWKRVRVATLQDKGYVSSGLNHGNQWCYTAAGDLASSSMRKWLTEQREAAVRRAREEVNWQVVAAPVKPKRVKLPVARLIAGK